MARCKDCLSYDVCPFHIDEETKMTVLECGHFKNKADYIEVIRCENCKQYNGHRYCCYFEMPVTDDDYCSYGERRTDDEM